VAVLFGDKMAKQVKHIYGNNNYYNDQGYGINYSTVLYTVPSGRIARIFPEEFRIGRDSSFTSNVYGNTMVKLSIGSSMVYTNSYSYYAYIDLTASLYQWNYDQMPAYQVNLYAQGPYWRAIEHPIILSAGQEVKIEVTFTGYYTYNKWNFMVIEEY